MDDELPSYLRREVGHIPLVEVQISSQFELHRALD